MKEISYRKVEITDIPHLVELRKSQLLEEGEIAMCDITESLHNFYQTRLSDGTFAAWVAIVVGEIIATSGISFTEKPPYYSNPTGKIGIVSNMYTLPQYRRQGIAKKLLNFAITAAREHGCGVIHLTASDAGACLYQHCGFVRNENFFQLKL